jgi:hypothetical protein
MYLTETHLQVRDMARDFANGAIRPIAEALDRDERFPSELYEEMGELGLFGIGVPEEMGGPGFDTLTYALVMEELSRGYASVADQCGLVELISTLLVRHGTEAQRKAFLPPILAAKTRVAYCITEPEAGTDVSGIRSRGGAGRRRLAAQRRQDLDPQRARGRSRLRARPHRPGGRESRHVDLHRRPARGGRRAGPQGTQDGPAGEPGRRADLHRRAAAGRRASGRGARLPHDDERARQGARGHRRACRRDRPGGARGGGGLRQARKQFGSPSPSSRASSGCSPTWPRTSRRRGSSSIRRR